MQFTKNVPVDGASTLEFIQDLNFRLDITKLQLNKPPIYLHLIFANHPVLDVKCDELDFFFPSLKFIFLPAVACKIQV